MKKFYRQIGLLILPAQSAASRVYKLIILCKTLQRMVKVKDNVFHLLFLQMRGTTQEILGILHHNQLLKHISVRYRIFLSQKLLNQLTCQIIRDQAQRPRILRRQE